MTQRQLKSKNSAVRRKAVQQLSRKPDQDALPALQTAVEDEDAEVRMWAAIALGKLPPETRTELLLTALRDRDPEVQKAAIQSSKGVDANKITGALAPLLR